MKLSDQFSLVAVMLVTGMVYALADKPAGAPESSPAEKSWFTAARSQSGGPCCSEADGFREGIVYPEGGQTSSGHYHPPGMILQEWRANKDKPGSYDINILGNWIYVQKENVVPGVNPTGQAVAWVVFNGGGLSFMTTPAIFVRCFAPGNMF